MRFLKRWKTRILILLAVVGPGVITQNVNNDAGGIYTYSLAGARYGYSLIWTLIPIFIALVVVQEMSARMGAVTGKGLADLIREEFGFRTTFFVMLALTITNLTNVMAEFAGVASSMQLFSVSKYIAVPAVAVFVWVLVVRGTYKSVEKIFLIASCIYLCYIFSGIMAKPDWLLAAQSIALPAFHFQSDFVLMVVGLIGASIAPWQHFFLDSAIVEKGVDEKKYIGARIDLIFGCIMMTVVAFFIMVSCAATLYETGHRDITDAADAAIALRPLAGEYASILFAVGLLNASVFAASILPLATAYTVCEGLGFEAGVNKKFRDAPVFYWLYTLLIAIGAGLVLLPRTPLVYISYLSQVVNGFLSPVILIFVLVLSNRADLLGRFKNSRGFNLVAGSTVAVLILLTLVWLALVLV